MGFNSLAERIWEVDAVRGLAVVLMIAYHFFFDLNYFGIAQIDLHNGFFLYFQRVIAFLFLTTVGVSLVLLKQKRSGFNAFVKRSAKLFLAAALITLATSIYPGNGAIWFGVIHFIAVASIIAFFFLDFYYLNLFLGVLLLGLSFAISLPSINSPYLLWLGFTPANFYALDYYPLFPWLGLVLLGVFVGKTFYEKNKIRFTKPFNTSALELIGKNALLIYLTHQLVLVALIKLFLVN